MLPLGARARFFGYRNPSDFALQWATIVNGFGVAAVLPAVAVAAPKPAGIPTRQAETAIVASRLVRVCIAPPVRGTSGTRLGVDGRAHIAGSHTPGLSPARRKLRVAMPESAVVRSLSRDVIARAALGG